LFQGFVLLLAVALEYVSLGDLAPATGPLEYASTVLGGIPVMPDICRLLLPSVLPSSITSAAVGW
jgi:hypothetical protein